MDKQEAVMKRRGRRVLTAAVTVLMVLGSVIAGQTHALSQTVPVAVNQSAPTLCAEVDNVRIPFTGNVASFVVEATSPRYPVYIDNCSPNFANCQPSGDPSFPFTPGIFKLFDDGETIVEAVREASWWRPKGMAVSVDGTNTISDAHYLRVYRKIDGVNEWPQFLVLYMDGNMRVIPQPPPPPSVSSVCFGSSVIVGPVATAGRPIAEISAANYNSLSKTLYVTYAGGGSASLSLRVVVRTLARVQVIVNYPTGTLPFAAFMSMYVADGNADVERVTWKGSAGVQDAGILAFPGGPGTDWFFYRLTRSLHNTSAPDIRVRLQSKTAAVFRDGAWAIDFNRNMHWDGAAADRVYSFGLPTDRPVTGDWNGDDRAEVGVFRNGLWVLDTNGNGKWDGPSQDRVLSFGLPTDIPVAGDWNGDGKTEVGVFRSGAWFLDYDGSGKWDGPVIDRVFMFGLPTDIPVTGDWNGDGKTEVGVFRSGAWFLDFTGDGVWDGCRSLFVPDGCFTFGLATDIPVTGDWNADGTTNIGVFRNGTWVLDLNGDGVWNGPLVDMVRSFGLATDKPVTGVW